MTAAIIIRQKNAMHLLSDGISYLRDGQVTERAQHASKK
jgi:hypothetical protein